MWYQISEEQSAIIAGALRDRRRQIERDIRNGVEYPFYSQSDMLRELSLCMELVEKFTDDGSLSLPSAVRENMLKW